MTLLRQKIDALPLEPGVYFMKDARGEILYIGKALSLRKRVRSYFSSRGGPEFAKIRILMSKVEEIDCIETATEVDALLLEASLVRKYQPRYNKELKDDKSYPLLKITHEAFPRIHLTRSKIDKQATYYGPYTDVKLLREAIALINHLFPLRKCQKLPKAACLYYHIGQCLAPCIKPDIRSEYDRVLGEVKTFLRGGKKSFVDYLTERMKEAASELRFEDAQFFKGQIDALGRLRRSRFKLKRPEASIVLSATLELKQRLGMERLPEKIICFDVSNIHGKEAAASKVSFYRELADKLEYRRYKIRSVSGINDYAMIQEALGRMLIGIKEGRETFIPDLVMIDGGKGHLHAAREVLIQEGFETTELIALAKKFETVFHYKTQKSREGTAFPSPAGVALDIPKDSPALRLLQRVRDEAHRFAITYHRSLKKSALENSVLDAIEGIGKKRKRLLLKQFDSTDELKRAGREQLAGLPGMNRSAARRVWNYFHAAIADSEKG
ncbi:MAG: excinuclease ABC subunit UvrC [Candidatus Omnitrophica bacterium]|nr:excinuclease ABC subunit UvrC [Candidatus Omnitrophota bacterium]